MTGSACCEPSAAKVDPALLVGYGNIKDTAIDEAVAALAEVIRASG